jgi:N-acetylmuramoyl-L-alanine amidase
MRRIIISPGHSRIEPGATAVIYDQTIRETDLNFVISNLIRNMLSLFNYQSVIVSRDIKLKDRHKQTEKDDVFISIHHNAVEEPEPCGFEVLYSSKTEHTDKNMALAKSVEVQVKDAFQNMRHRETKIRNGLFILKSSPCPAIMIECGFMSNPAELRRLVNPTHQIKMARAITQGIIYWEQR